jgi:hypothetical protein
MSEKMDQIRKEMKESKDSEFWKKAEAILPKASIMKKNMLDKGLTRAKAKCPFCEGHWHARLAGKKNHFHMRCDGDCKSFMME